jgi:hypothetical protein
MKKIIESNVMEGYDNDGNLVMYYWQKDPIKEVWGFGGFKVSWKYRLNPIWRIKQWWFFRKGHILKVGEKLK